jgi:hypothetical protein
MKSVPLRECLASLPVGFLLEEKDGKFSRHRDFDLSSITGRTRLQLGKSEFRGNAGRQTTELLRLTLRKLGPLEAVDSDMIRSLTFIDREFLNWIHMLRRIKTENIELQDTCDSCGEIVDTSVATDDLLVNVLEEDDCAVKDGLYQFTFKGEEFGELCLRLLTGVEEEKHSVYREKNPEEAAFRDLHAALVHINGKQVSFSEFLDLPEDTVEWIQAAANSLDLGSSQRIVAECQECGEENTLTLTPLALLGDWEPKAISPPYEMKSST